MVSYRILPLLGSVLLACPVLAQEPSPTPPVSGISSSASTLLHQLDEAYVQLFNKMAPSVVVIDATKKSSDGDADSQGFDFFFHSPDNNSKKQFKMPEMPNKAEGSGFILRPDGFIITNNHVIEGAEKITVRLRDGRQLPATVVGADDRSDIAVIKIDATGLAPVDFGDSDAVRTGQHVCAIGVPYELDYSFTAGVVSGKGRTALQANQNYEDYIQTDAFINPGNSGGPLFDVDGRVVGMNTLINGIGRGLAFAIPSNMLKQVSEQLIATGKIVRPWLGIRIETLGDKPDLREQIQGIDKGVLITSIEADTPASKGDLRPADVVTAVDGVSVTTAHDLQKLILTKKIGQEVAISIWRDGKTIKVPVTTGELPSSIDTTTTSPADDNGNGTQPDNDDADASYGLSLEDVTPENSDRLGLKQKTGVLVSDIAGGSPAAIAGIQQNDVITEIDSKPVANIASARKLLQEHDSKKALLLFLERKGQKTYAVLKSEK